MTSICEDRKKSQGTVSGPKKQFEDDRLRGDMKLGRRVLSWLLAAVFLAALVAAPAEAARRKKEPPPDPVKLGVIMPLTGSRAQVGQAAYKAILLARQDRPEAGARKVELLLSDTESRPEGVAEAMKRLIEKDKVTAIIGPPLAASAALAAPLAEAGGVPLILVCPDSDEPLPGRRFVFSSHPDPALEAQTAADLVRDRLKVKAAAVYGQPDQPRAQAWVDRFAARFDQSDGRLVDQGALAADDSARLAGLAAKLPGLIALAGDPEWTARTAARIRDMGLNQPLIFSQEARAPELISLGGRAVEGAYLVADYDRRGLTSVVGTYFARTYTRTHHQPIIPDYVAWSYDAYNLILDAVERADSVARDRIAEFVGRTVDLAGVTGSIAYQGPWPVKPVYLIQIDGGKYRLMESMIPH